MNMIQIRRKEYLLVLRNHFDRLVKLAEKKSAGYASDKDGFKNFNLVEHLTNGVLTAEDGILTRLADKISRVSNLLAASPCDIGSLYDNLDDMAVYSLILRIAIEQRREQNGIEKYRDREGSAGTNTTL